MVFIIWYFIYCVLSPSICHSLCVLQVSIYDCLCYVSLLLLSIYIIVSSIILLSCSLSLWASLFYSISILSVSLSSSCHDKTLNLSRTHTHFHARTHTTHARTAPTHSIRSIFFLGNNATLFVFRVRVRARAQRNNAHINCCYMVGCCVRQHILHTARALYAAVALRALIVCRGVHLCFRYAGMLVRYHAHLSNDELYNVSALSRSSRGARLKRARWASRRARAHTLCATFAL